LFTICFKFQTFCQQHLQSMYIYILTVHKWFQVTNPSSAKFGSRTRNEMSWNWDTGSAVQAMVSTLNVLDTLTKACRHIGDALIFSSFAAKHFLCTFNTREIYHIKILTPRQFETLQVPRLHDSFNRAEPHEVCM
jgi:hypothetical protein